MRKLLWTCLLLSLGACTTAANAPISASAIIGDPGDGPDVEPTPAPSFDRLFAVLSDEGALTAPAAAVDSFDYDPEQLDEILEQRVKVIDLDDPEELVAFAQAAAQRLFAKYDGDVELGVLSLFNEPDVDITVLSGLNHFAIRNSLLARVIDEGDRAEVESMLRGNVLLYNIGYLDSSMEIDGQDIVIMQPWDLDGAEGEAILIGSSYCELCPVSADGMTWDEWEDAWTSSANAPEPSDPLEPHPFAE